MPDTLAPSPPLRRRWLQFRLRTLLIAMAVLAIPLAWIANERHKIAARHKVFAEMSVEIRSIQPQPAWRVWLLGDDYPAYATAIKIHALTDGSIAHFQDLTRLESIIVDAAGLTNGWLAKLPRIRSLKVLTLFGSGFTGTGFVHLQANSQLEELCLLHTAVTDDGLAQLEGLAQLRLLMIESSRVSDAGLLHLKKLPQLKELFLLGAAVTDGGVSELQEALPTLKIYRRPAHRFD